MSTWTLAKTLARKKILSPFQKKLLPRLFITYPKAYAKETPFMDLLLNSHMFVFVCTVLALRAREERNVPVKGATYPRRALGTREGRCRYPRRALHTRKWRYVPPKPYVPSHLRQSHLIESHLFNNNFKDSKNLQHQNQTQHKHRARWKKDTSGRRTVKSRSKSKINKSKSRSSKSSSKDRSTTSKSKSNKNKSSKSNRSKSTGKSTKRSAKTCKINIKHIQIQHKQRARQATPNYVIHMKPDIHPQNTKHAKKKPI